MLKTINILFLIVIVPASAISQKDNKPCELDSVICSEDGNYHLVFTKRQEYVPEKREKFEIVEIFKNDSLIMTYLKHNTILVGLIMHETHDYNDLSPDTMHLKEIIDKYKFYNRPQNVEFKNIYEIEILKKGKHKELAKACGLDKGAKETFIIFELKILRNKIVVYNKIYDHRSFTRDEVNKQFYNLNVFYDLRNDEYFVYGDYNFLTISKFFNNTDRIIFISN